MNLYAIRAIYVFGFSSILRTFTGNVAVPIVSTSLYFLVFGSAIGAHMPMIDQVSYAAFIVPGLTMLVITSESIGTGSFGIFIPRFTGTIYEVLSAPISAVEIVIGYVGVAAIKATVLGALVLAISRLFVDYRILHPLTMVSFLVLTSVTFSLLGFIIGVWADRFEQMQTIPSLVITPLTFLGGTFYSISMLPEFWQRAALLNPFVYLISGFRWSFFGTSEVRVEVCLSAIVTFMLLLLMTVWLIFRTGYKIKT